MKLCELFERTRRRVDSDTGGLRRYSVRGEKTELQRYLYANIWLKKTVGGGRMCIDCICIKIYRKVHKEQCGLPWRKEGRR